MKIVMLCDFYDEKVQYQENLLGKYYVKHGHQVTVIAATFDNSFAFQSASYDESAPARQYYDGRVKVIKLPYSLNLLNRLRRFRGVDAILNAERPDLIFLHDMHLNLTDAARYRRLHNGCRIVMDYHADYSNSGRNWFSLNVLHKLIRRSLFCRYRSSIDRIFPVVPASATFLREVYGVEDADMELLPLGADTDLAESAKLERTGTAMRRRLGIADDDLVIFTGGKLTPAKRTHLLVEALQQVADPRLHLLVVGDVVPEDAGYMRRLISASSGSSQVHFVGWVDAAEVYRLMEGCDFAVFPASQSVLWQQALAMGLPLIVGQVGVQDPSYLNANGCMVILKEGSIRSEVIADRIRELIRQPALLAERQAAARRTANELLNYDRIILQTLADERPSKGNRTAG